VSRSARRRENYTIWGFSLNGIRYVRMCPLSTHQQPAESPTYTHTLLYTHAKYIMHKTQQQPCEWGARVRRPKQVRHFLDASQATTLNLILPPTPAARCSLSLSLSQDGNKLKSARARLTFLSFFCTLCGDWSLRRCPICASQLRGLLRLNAALR
jgi:hypothetical protein